MLNTDHYSAANTVNKMCYQMYPPIEDEYPCFNRLSLWSFIFNLLEDQHTPCVRWTDREKLEFKIEDTEGLAQEWGQRKGKNTMTWAKFARAMRYYYGKDVLEKVERKRFTYKFIDSPKTRSVIRSTNRAGRSTNPSPVSPAMSSTDSSTQSIISEEDYANISTAIDIMNPPTITTASGGNLLTNNTISINNNTSAYTNESKDYEQVKIDQIKKELEICVTQCQHAEQNSYTQQQSTNSLYNSNSSFNTQTTNANIQNRFYNQHQNVVFNLPTLNANYQPTAFNSSSNDQKVPNGYSASNFTDYFAEEDFSPRSSYSPQQSYSPQPSYIERQNSLTACERAILASLVDTFQ